jgi:hypothetical protein
MKKIGIAVLVLLLGFALAQTQKKVIAAGYACQTKSLFKTMYAIKDSKARDKKLAPNIKNTQCVILKKGDAVEQTGTSFVDDLVKIKYPNKLIGYWTASEFLN